MTIYDLAIIGGGPAGLFAAIWANTTNPSASIAIFEQTNALCAKILLSGGGRCNLTNSLKPLSAFAEQYPRGKKELLGPLHRFGPDETCAWFESKKILLKTENDGRIFPTSNSAKEIHTCLLSAIKTPRIHLYTSISLETTSYKDALFAMSSTTHPPLYTKKLILATGSAPFGYKIATQFGHTIIPPLPALFPLKINHPCLPLVAGQTISSATISIPNTPFAHTGPLLFTHHGISGPCAIILSSKAARFLAEHSYTAPIAINYLPHEKNIVEQLRSFKQKYPQKQLSSHFPFPLSKTIWAFLTKSFGQKKYADISHSDILQLHQKLTQDKYSIIGKATHADEFVTCGGIALNEIDFRTLSSKKHPSLFFAGEILDIDGFTGGFNLQNCWTTGFIAGTSALQTP